MPGYIPRKAINPLPGKVIKAVPLPEPSVESGFGARGKVGEICRLAGYSSVLLVTDKTLFSLGYHEKVKASVEAQGIACAVFAEINSEPDSAVVQKGREAALDADAQCVIALGGGSVLDACKIIAAGARLKKLSIHLLLQKFLIVPGETLPIIGIPSTAGTGAEITVGAMISDHKSGSKGSTVVVGLNVTNVILDSELMVHTPRAVTAACGIDALSHGLEGCVAAVKVDPEDEWKSRECVRLVLENLPKVLEDPENVEARQRMCLAAHYGGNAINRQLAGYVHAFAHSIGARYHIPHGNAIAMSLMPVMEYQKQKCLASLAALAVHCGLASEGDDEAAAADSLLAAVDRLVENCSLDAFRSKIDPADNWILVRLISFDSINYSSPMVFNDQAILDILEQIENN